MLQLFRGTCLAVRAMHEYRPTSARSAAAVQNERRPRPNRSTAADDDNDERFPQPEGDAEGGYSYDGASVPLVTKHRVEMEHDVVFDGDEELEHNDGPPLDVIPYAHRDLKPGCAFITFNGSSSRLTVTTQKRDDR